MSRKIVRAMALAGLAALLAGARAPLKAPAWRGGPVDLAILGGLVIDGTGAPGRSGDVLVRGVRIVFVGRVDRRGLVAGRTIRAEGKLVSPGFIDLHSHGNPLVEPSFANFLLQGVTTIVLGQDGVSPQAEDVDYEASASLGAWRAARKGGPRAGAGPVTLAQWMAAVDAKRPDVNIATLSGFGVDRTLAGVGAAPVPTAGQLAAEKEILGADLEAGAFGMSSGLEYVPDRYSRTAELAALADVVGDHGGVVMSHMRSEDDDQIAQSIAELAAQGRRARVNISHLKIVFGKTRAQAEAVLAQIRRIRAGGVEMSADVYPYIAGFADMTLLYPPWAKRKDEWDAAVQGRRPELEAYLHARVLKRNGPQAILIASGPYAGMTLKEVAEKKAMSFEKVLIDVFGYPGPDAAHRVMASEAQETFVAAPDVAISTDGGPRIRHPRSWGTYPKVLREYVVDSHRLTIEAAIHKMTGLPAHVLRLADRGRIAIGAKADIDVIDLAAIKSTATWEKFDQAPLGFVAVVVNGAVAAENGRAAPMRYGRVLRRPGSHPAAGGNAP